MKTYVKLKEDISNSRRLLKKDEIGFIEWYVYDSSTYGKLTLAIVVLNNDFFSIPISRLTYISEEEFNGDCEI